VRLCPPYKTGDAGHNAFTIASSPSVSAAGPGCRISGDVRDALKALIVANEFLESVVCELMPAVSHAYLRGRFKTYAG
jgi:hypothetical protein